MALAPSIGPSKPWAHSLLRWKACRQSPSCSEQGHVVRRPPYPILVGQVNNRMSVADLSPMVPAAVSMRVINRRTVSEACTEGHWIHDISSALIVEGIMELLHLVEIVGSPILSADTRRPVRLDYLRLPPVQPSICLHGSFRRRCLKTTLSTNLG